MVEVKPQAASRFVSALPPELGLAVIAGRDRGRVKETSDAIARSFLGSQADPMNTTLFQASEWKAAPERIVESALSPSLLGGRRIIRIIDADKACAKACEAWLERVQPPNDTLLIAESGDLTKADGLRKLASSSPKAALLFFYADEIADVAGLIRQVLTETHGFQVAPDALDLLKESLGGDRLISRGELEKLALYAHGQDQITLDDVKAVVSDAAKHEFEPLNRAITVGDFATLDREFHRLVDAGENVNAILAVVRAHFARLKELRFYMDGGMNFSSASTKMRPPIFWKSKGLFEQAMALWTTTKLEQANSRLLETFVEVRSTGRPELETAQRGLFALTAMAKRKS